MTEMNNITTSSTTTNTATSSILITELEDVTPQYKEMMDRAKVEDFSDIEQSQCFIPVGCDTDGSPVYLIIATNLPIGKEGLEKLLKYICLTLEPIVKGSQYTLVYSHHLLRNESTPEKSWLTSTYQMLPRKYVCLNYIYGYNYNYLNVNLILISTFSFKKNLKHFYIIHPSTWLRVMFMAMSPFLSEKVWRNKLAYIDYIQELPDTLDRALIKSKLPEAVREYDEELLGKPEVAEQVMSTMESLGKELLSAFATPSLLGGDPAKWG
ncbi:hypothetical protein PPL_09013 [Heterostelium album PN500]|uniref:CRAL-TRIO domain-containing protein n=1 Tax=Heterostelium pallidum (strain ATCC 26659 / Pp 5 / PN500) TaxID=670386 RepID=D3BKD2_HETP5|nr:hypothetical protein PPL_09013 [Heterostelium album PN500]EFA78362.1 hypothetical protein PPL_09013 [Heterostelium album PN500]|eukprot:XP_020430487.1 hypothetical protein PPL_09013 [Heterostelium album PN500]